MSELLSMTQAASQFRVEKAKLLDLAVAGQVNGAVRGEGRTGRWKLPRTEIERLLSEGTIKPKKTKGEYLKRGKNKTVNKASSAPLPAGERISIVEAAARFGLGRSTLEKYVATGKLAGEKAQLGPGRSKTFVRTEDVAALRAKTPVTMRGKHRKTGKHVAADPQPLTGLNSELLKLAEMVRGGSYSVTRLSVGLEFTGGGE